MPKHDDQEPFLGLRLVGDHIVSFRRRWIELLFVPPFPDADGQLVSEHDPTPYPFPPPCREVEFGRASLSEPQPNPKPLDNSRIIYILAQHMTVGFFYFRATIYNPDYVPSGPRARMDVDLIGVYEVDKPQVGMGEPRHALGSWLGPEGKRGIWIECSLDRCTIFVVAVSFDLGCPAGARAESGDDRCEITPRITSTDVIFVFESWNPTGG